MKNKIKKNWKIILICVLALFGMSKCTTSCNRQGIIDKQNVTLSTQDSIINAQNDSIKYLNLELAGERDKGSAVQDAHNLGNDYYVYTINKLNDEIKENQKIINNLRSEVNKKNKEVLNLKENISKLESQLELLNK